MQQPAVAAIIYSTIGCSPVPTHKRGAAALTLAQLLLCGASQHSGVEQREDWLESQCAGKHAVQVHARLQLLLRQV
jgi:hypothetical protein